MKLKNISKLLVSTILLSNFNLPSFAGILSEDGRYETFEGNNIIVNNVLEDEKVGVEIKGNTLVNLIDYSKINTHYYNYNLGYISENNSDNRLWENIEQLSNLKPKTRYTIVVDDLDTASAVHIGFNKSWQRQIYNRVTVFETPSVVDCGFVFKIHGEQANIKMMLFEGDWTDKEIPKYFEGMKSVGQDDENGHNLEIISQNKNLLKRSYIKTGAYAWANGEYLSSYTDRCCSENFIKVEKGKTLYRNKKSVFFLYDKNFNYLGNTYIGYKGGSSFSTNNYLVEDGVEYIKIEFSPEYEGDPKNSVFDDAMVSYEPILSYIDNQADKKEILLNEPLRGLPNGVKDRIIKKNGQWMVERNCKEVTVDGSEEWIMVGDKKQNTACFFTRDIKGITFENDFKSATPTLSNLFVSSNTDWIYTNDDNVEISYTAWDGNLCFSILKSKLSSVSVDGFKEWLSINNPRVIYQLPNPIYEPLNVDSILNLYLDTTYISNDSIIPANMRIIVDRVINRAQEAIELVKSNPTTENISQARYWSNLMKESVLKDEFQNEINANTDITDLSIEKKTASANVDMYIKMKNTLSLSLDTNSITFENFNASEDLEMINAVNLTVSSSLPYKINTCLESELYNSDKSAMIDKSVLNIKNSSDAEYKAFNDVLEPLLLLDNQMEGDSISHSIDLILRGGSTHKADVYKTTIKFEVEQK